MRTKSSTHKLINWSFYICSVLLITAFWFRNDFAPRSELQLVSDINEPPKQQRTNKKPFNIYKNDVLYKVEPLYDYALTGLVVSYNHHDGQFGSHKRWQDHINVADLCVVWGDNAKKLDLNKFEFWSGEFTCFYQTKDYLQYKLFKNNELSNNHLITDSEIIRDAISDVKIGDQIKIKGWLSKYSNHLGGSRGTSTTREDTGNGACETIYVNDFQIVSSMKTGWRTLLDFSLIGTILSALVWCVGVFRGVF
ncbi:hypothetical protein H0A36_01095 [Endozoicomonas sp. SM1973]|uniref:Uncharacterized protein n=1 Tax=Spartinivicinus marinus TaxID=2994442 RepID=A0A853HTH2_9GAMM|nr:hypothetical protein [Spartinivicinus marinus]MCX4026749.1 hypothetical protein [Spartinivicinus marinus]NYZ64583.1 hypothetical protein [Spartinivicinus marinus]